MPTKAIIQKALKKKKEGKSPSTQAGEFVHEEMKHLRQGKHRASSHAQAIAIGLSKARQAGIKLPPYKDQKSTTSASKKKSSSERSRPRMRTAS